MKQTHLVPEKLELQLLETSYRKKSLNFIKTERKGDKMSYENKKKNIKRMVQDNYKVHSTE